MKTAADPSVFTPNDWKRWFETDDAAEAVKIIRRDVQADQPVISKQAYRELVRIVRAVKGSAGNNSATPGELWEQMTSISLEEFRKYVTTQTKGLQESHAQLEQKRTVGWRKATTGFQEFAMNFDRFLIAYAGVVGIAKEIDEHYGGIASATLSLLYATVKMKAKNEERIGSTMRQIADRLPDVEIYQKIYAERELGNKILNAYIKVVQFSRLATEYHQTHGYSRVFRSMANPDQFTKLEQEVRESLTNVRARCEALLSERVAQLYITNSQLKDQVSELKEQVTELTMKLEDSMQNADRHGVSKLRLQLGLHNEEVGGANNAQLGDYRKLLAALFDRYRELTRMPLTSLEEYAEYQQWHEDDGSSLLILHGCNAKGYQLTANFCWLSEVACELIERLLSSPATKPKVAYYLWQRGDNAQLDADAALDGEDILPRLCSQFLDKNPTILRKADDKAFIDMNIRRSINGPDSPQSIKSHETPTKALRTRLGDLESALHRVTERIEGTAYIIIDRLDSCEPTYRRLLLEKLITLVRLSENLKILVVVKQEVWPINARVHELELDDFDSPPVLLRIDQERKR